MYFQSLTLYNFGPYLGTHELNLKVSDEHPVIVFHGENMRGKTSLFNALRWVMYGQALDRQGEIIPDADLFNSIAIEDGESEAWVELVLDDAGDTYLLKRKMSVDRGRVDVSCRVQMGGVILSAEAGEGAIARLMDESISRFFLFDGEMLGEYEKLLGDSTTEGELVKSSIESILGLPALRLLADDLSQLAADAYVKQSQRNAAEKKADQAAADHATKSVLLAEAEKDARRLESRLIRLNADRKMAESELAALNDAKVAMETIRSLEQRRDASAAEVESLKGRIQVLLRERWWFPVSSRIDEQLKDVRDRLKSAAARDARLNALRESERNLDESLQNANCDTCGQPLPKKQVKPIEIRLLKVREEIREVTAPMTPSVPDLLALEDKLRPFSTPSDVTLLRDHDLRIRKLQQEIRISNQEITEHENRLRGHEAADVRARQVAYDEAVKGIQRVEADLRDTRDRKAKLQAELSGLQRKAASGVRGSDALAIEHAMFQTLSDLFEGAIDRFREALRADVESEASAIFQRLTTEKAYQGLKINDQYGLRILDENGQVLRMRSAGAEQVVALSLIGALNACAIRRGPLVMDTPFGRLDDLHRTNILDWAPTVSKQVILLVQSGEIDPSGTLLPKLRPLVRREYRIVRDGSPRKSKVEIVNE